MEFIPSIWQWFIFSLEVGKENNAENYTAVTRSWIYFTDDGSFSDVTLQKEACSCMEMKI